MLKFPGNWEVPFELISELQWLGSGAQGAVFLGRLNDEPVAVKKVRNAGETDILHLRKLSHPNIIKFKYVNLRIAILTVVASSKVVLILSQFCPLWVPVLSKELPTNFVDVLDWIGHKTRNNWLDFADKSDSDAIIFNSMQEFCCPAHDLPLTESYHRYSVHLRWSLEGISFAWLLSCIFFHFLLIFDILYYRNSD